MQERIAQEDLEKTQKIAADMKDIKEMSEDLHTNVNKDDEGLAKVNDNLGKVKDHMDEGCDSLRAVSSWFHTRYCDLSRYTMLVLTFCMWIRESRRRMHAIRQLCTPSFVLWFY